MDEPKPKEPKGRGEFFSVDRKTWEAAANLRGSDGRPGPNPAIALLVLARFSDKSNTKTEASVHAVEKHTGISRPKAKVAIDALLKAGLISRTNAVGDPSPHYEIHVPPAPGVALARDGRRIGRRSGTSSPKPEPIPKDEPIWLPNDIVTGASGEKPPIARLREAHDVLLLRLFVDLYRVQNLRESYGIDRQILWRSYTKVSAGSAAGFDLWRFVPGPPNARGSAEPAVNWLVYGGKGDHEEVSANFWQRLKTLRVLGLIKWVSHLYNSADDDGEVLYAYGTEGTEDIEDRVGQAAHDAALALIEQKRGGEPADVEKWLVPIRMHMKDVAMIGVVQLRYHSRTLLTSAWWAEHRKKGEEALEDFQRIRAGACANAR